MADELDLEFQSVFEESEDAIKERVLARPELEKYRKEPGDFVYDVVVAGALDTQQQGTNMDATLRHAFPVYAEDIYLDMNVAGTNMEPRFEATIAQGKLQVTARAGVTIQQGQELITTAVDADGNPIIGIVTEEVIYTAEGTQDILVDTQGEGASMNVEAGSAWTFLPTLSGIISIDQAEDFEGGRDRESDESLLQRWKNAAQLPRRSGNKLDYDAWAQEVIGVGTVKPIPLWDGDGTVKLIIADIEGRPATAEMINAVQTYIDPYQDGMGDGKAPVGAIVTVESSVDKLIDAAAKVVLMPGATMQQVIDSFKVDFDTYLSGVADLALSSSETQYVIYKKVEALLGANELIADYSNFTLNGGTTNIAVQGNEIPVRGMVNFT
ncbi:baseplate J/gp47 family protein [Domibacillus indicus]|uniref:baseplate J/gp47 family protein n=1 Tax=Domibacillus indicus TaxID=1437523 RepID=UPI00203F14A5|nr:baseplate J/gp47 family protein [Domibacillus indicus]MCM3789416.1 baseplate J/gp47 family protein [Domibacillus indicus]